LSKGRPPAVGRSLAKQKDNSSSIGLRMGQSDKTSSTSAFPWKEFLAFLGVILAAYIGYLGIRSQIEIPIKATQTAEAKLTLIAQMPEGNNATSSPTEILSTSTPFQVSPNTISKISFTLPTHDDLSAYPNLMEGNFYKNPKIPSTNNYQVDVSVGVYYIWGFTWCAQDRDHLNNNLGLINLSFLIEESKIPDENIYEYGTSKSGWECHAWSTLLSNWTKGDKIKVTVQYFISGKAFDGKYNYEPGQYRHDVLILVQ
jgi:hypothetical protein